MDNGATKKNSPAIHHGKISGNLPAEAYAAPHTMSGKAVGISDNPGGVPNKEYLRNANVSVANSRSNEYPGTKTDGLKTRGNGAAVKGVTARGPMA
jgi:hypothetical protein